MPIKKLCSLLNLNYEKALACLDLVAVNTTIALSRLHSIAISENKEFYVGTSGGKDSDVVVDLYLTYCNDIIHSYNPIIIHNTRPDIINRITIDYLYTRNYPIIYCNTVLPIQRSRIQIDGSRRCEASRTNGRSTDFISDGKSVDRTDLTLFTKVGLFGLPFVYPIYDWSDEQVWMYHVYKEIPCSKEYGEVSDALDKAISYYRAARR